MSTTSPSILYFTCPSSPTGAPANPYLRSLLHECVYDARHASSLLLGYASIAFWICAQMPQLWKNYRRKSADSLSGAFLTNWLLGDVCNLVGCLLTGQLPFQTNLAMYFVFADTLLMTQYLYYLNVRRKRLARRSGFFISLPTSPSSTDLLRHRHAASPSAEVETETSPLLTPTETRRNAGSSGTFFGVALFAFTAFANNVGVRSSSSAVVPPSTVYSMESGGSGMTLETAPTLSQTIGLFVAYTCTTLYLCSRLPQIYHTFCRRSTQGLSMSMFVCAAMGNLTYVLSILCNSTEFDHVVAAAPYLLGSGGTLGFDLLIFVQFLWYRRRGNVGVQRAKRELVLPPPQAVLEDMRDERELSLDVEDQGEIGWEESTKGGSTDSLV
ncbi:hypothetical protein HKX48_008665 [Thoreauomyces humboldtii]|nr:hypothetical protein HKX48_008665 [Thoreauomyces humboldtii]